jgi:hypothetical protein
MVDLNEYRLTYFRKSDGRKFLARRLTGQEYVLFDPEENSKLRITYHFLRKTFVSCPDNFRKNKERFSVRVC